MTRHFLGSLPGQRDQSFVPRAWFRQKPPHLTVQQSKTCSPGCWLTPAADPRGAMARAELPTAAPLLLVQMPALRVCKQYKGYVNKNSKTNERITTVCVLSHKQIWPGKDGENITSTGFIMFAVATLQKDKSPRTPETNAL